MSKPRSSSSQPHNSWRYPPKWQWFDENRTPVADVRTLDKEPAEPAVRMWLPAAGDFKLCSFTPPITPQMGFHGPRSA